MIDESSPHGIEDYINGVVPTNNAYILNERFTDEIIGGLSLGDSFEKVRMVLGNPGWETDDILLFRTQNYYLLFQGNQRADYAVVMKAPVNEYPPDILKIILEALNGEEYLSLEESLLKIDLKDGFFEEWGFIHGGGYYYSTKNGINLIDFDEKYIEVYNNYEGDLYQYALPDPRFEVRFIDRDMVIDYMLNEFNRYLEVEELFQNDGVVSPDGKLCAVYEWLYSMNHHFIVRTLDHSIQDRYIYVSSESTFQWLTNNHLVYIDPYNQIPYAIDVNFSDPGAINILYEAGIINERDVDPGKYEYELIEANTQSVILKDRLNDQTVTVQFSEDKKGSISFTAQ